MPGLSQVPTNENSVTHHNNKKSLIHQSSSIQQHVGIVAGQTKPIPSKLQRGDDYFVIIPSANSTPHLAAKHQLSDTKLQSNRHSRLTGSQSSFGCVETYQKLDVLGEGSYATVYRGYSR